jgi:hypothetical protein
MSTDRYTHIGSVHIQGAPGHPLITILPETIESLRTFQKICPDVDVSKLINDAINKALDEKDEEIRRRSEVGT